MATEKMEIQVSADVNKAVAGINTLNKSLKQTPTALDKLNKSTGQSTQTLVNFGRVVQDAPFGIIGIANNIDPLISSFTALRASTGSAGAAFKALGASLIGPAGIAVAVSSITSALIAFGPQIKNFIAGIGGAGKASEEEAEKLDKAAESISKNYTQVLLLTTALKNGKTTLEERRDIISQLNTVSDKYFGGLNAEKLSIEALEKAYDGYVNNLLRSFAVKQLEQDLEPFIKRLATAQVTLKRFGDDIKNLGLENVDLRNLSEQQRQALATTGVFEFNAAKREEKTVREEINKLIEGALFLTAEETKTVKPVKEKNVELKEQVKVYQDLIKVQNELIQRSRDPSQQAIPNRPNPINIQRADRTSAVVITPEALRLQAQYGILLDEILEKQRQQQAFAQQLSDTINNGINAGIDTFFNAIANNQDPFEALAQSAKRLVVELGAAVVKALALKAISSLLSGGATTGLEGLAGGLGANGGGILDLILRGDLLTGAIGGSATRRRRF